MPLSSPIPDLDIPDISLPDFLLRYLQEHDDGVALIDNRSGRTLTYRDAYAQTVNCAVFLQNRGLKKGEVVALCIPNCIEYVATLLGIMACGATVDLCNPDYTETELAQQLKISKPVMVIVSEKSAGTIKRVAKTITYIRHVYSVGKTEELCESAEIFNEDNNQSYFRNKFINARTDVALISYSSGTTGLPKGVMLTHRSLVASSIIFAKMSGYTKNEIFCFDRPMFHSGGFSFLFNLLPIGGKIVFEQDFGAVCLPDLIDTHRISVLLAVPQALLALAHYPHLERYEMSTLKEIMCGGAMLSPQLLDTVKTKYKTNIAIYYGSTEAGDISSNNDIDHYCGSVGFLLPNTKAKIADIITNQELPNGSCGEILIKGPQTFKGYLENPEQTLSVLAPDGWFRTGDSGYVSDGVLYVSGRLKEVIKYKTLQVAPAELEAVIFSHAGVADVGVIGIPDSYAGELPKAFVVKKIDSLSEEEIQVFVNAKLTDYKRLRGGVEFVQKIPRSRFGKIQRDELKKLHQYDSRT